MAAATTFPTNTPPQTSDHPEIEDTLIANVYYLKPDPLYDEEKPYSLASHPPPGIKKTNIVNSPTPTIVRNARGFEKNFFLYTHGFEWLDHDLKLDPGFGADEGQLDEYMNEMDVIPYILRQVNKKAKIRWQRTPSEERPDGASKKVKRHILGAHLDISKESAKMRIRLKCGEEAETLLKRRWHIVNVWRPLQEPVVSMPLALCDSRSLDDDDLVASDIIYPHLELEASELWYNSNQRWYYLKGQMMNEVLLIMNVDSGSSTRCPHTAFEDPTIAVDAPRRRSIELRCMVFL
ncbi:hypothetical protein B0T21DRAFT_389709 [Apiosordaria backusii]|uniref:Uncharacterized protein n=1 Tax=Apiosordaria backusii TaxID=314023 RepID=A0AA40K398_9PEZI|nr:hypothetical protein B0T21DRAFT_389709 [Apiosordaria backusii]